MFTKLALAVVVLSSFACSAPLPPASRLNSDAAVDAVFRAYGRVGQRPRVWAVEDDGCFGTRGKGFVDPAIGRCVGGFTDGDDIFIVWGPGMRWSESGLAHELRHVMGRDHVEGGTWEPESEDGRAISAAQSYLRSLPELDAMELAR